MGGQVGGRRADTGGDGRGRAGPDNGKKDVIGQACGHGHGFGCQKVWDCVAHGCEGSVEDGRGRADAFSGFVFSVGPGFSLQFRFLQYVEFRCNFVACSGSVWTRVRLEEIRRGRAGTGGGQKDVG